MWFSKKFQFDNSNEATTIKRRQCSLYLGQEITDNSLPFTCLKNNKYQHVPGTEIPNAILWGWNQLSNINLPHVPTAIADIDLTRSHWLLLNINTGNSTSLKNKMRGGLAHSKCIRVAHKARYSTQSHRYKMCLKQQHISSSQETEGCSSCLWERPWRAGGREAGRGDDVQGYALLSITDLYGWGGFTCPQGRLRAKQIIAWKAVNASQ